MPISASFPGCYSGAPPLARLLCSSGRWNCTNPPSAQAPAALPARTQCVNRHGEDVPQFSPDAPDNPNRPVAGGHIERGVSLEYDLDARSLSGMSAPPTVLLAFDQVWSPPYDTDAATVHRGSG